MGFLLWLSALACVQAAVDADEVTSMPGFKGKMPSKVYSGYLKTTAVGQTFYSHYTLTLSQNAPTTDPLVVWQQGGPGSSGFGYGYFAELGPYQLNADSLTENSTGIPEPFLNKNSWDRIANLLIFEHPPGTGFSYCEENGKVVPCVWNDQTAGEAFLATLEAFYESYSEFSKHDLYVIGESYAGLLIPFMAHQLLLHPNTIPAKQLKALAMGNGCPGTSGSTPNKRGTCNGPYGSYDTQHVAELAYGHSGASRELYAEVSAECGFPCKAPTWSEDCNTFSDKCHTLLQKFSDQVGEFNIYNFYDNCGSSNQYSTTGEDKNKNKNKNKNTATFMEHLARLSEIEVKPDSDSDSDPSDPHEGGQSYPCGTGRATVAWCNNEEVRAALHMHSKAFYGRDWSLQAGPGMKYTTYTGSSYDLYPDIIKKYRVLIYNGDVDACVPYNSNEDWTAALAAQQGYKQLESWRPWLQEVSDTSARMPGGYVTTYATNGPANFTFLTVKESGHMVPQYQPGRAFTFYKRWLNDEPY